MARPLSAATLAVACLPALCAGQVQAHAVAVTRVFPVTLTIDDPGVADVHLAAVPRQWRPRRHSHLHLRRRVR